MTTIVDPLGTPVPVYNKSGTTVLNIAASGTDASSATPIVTSSQITIVMVSNTAGNTAVLLPTSSEIGDVIELYNFGGAESQINAFSPSGVTINQSLNSAASAFNNRGAILRKTSSENWQVIGGV